MAIVRESALLGNKEITIETGRIAKQAGGSVVVQSGETVVLVTACEGGKRDLPFFPLSVDYVEKMYAAGRIPGGYLKREGRLGEHEILASRCIDRPVRPLFADGYNNDTQIVATVLSSDGENDGDVLAITGASTALMLSEIPWDGPVAGVRVGRIDGEFVANPTNSERAKSEMDIVVVATADAIVMVEGGGDEVSETVMLDALDFARESVKDILNLQLRLREACGKEKMTVQPEELDPEAVEAVQDVLGKDRMMAALTVKEKHARYAALDALKAAVLEELEEEWEGETKELKRAFDKIKKQTMRRHVTREKRRIDGRRPEQIRKITVEAGILPRTHGSALFTRGETQGLVTTTLGTGKDNQRYETLTGQHTREFLLHYNFPAFSVGETKPLRGPGRREIGHGNLAWRALLPMVPEGDFPYVIRLVSEITESNGSSSMATVCGGSLAMMDAGVPLRSAVAGIAMGLIKEGDDIVVLSDILGDEDHMGDMDFKVCGTDKGITAFQMDTKISGIDRATMRNALLQARDGRLHILERMNATLAKPRTEMSPHAPRILTINIKPAKIGAVIGSGGKTIRGICEVTGADISVDDSGLVTIASANNAAAQKAIKMIEELTQEAEVGKTYMGVVRKIMDFGAFIQVLPGIDGLCPISELTEGRVEKVEDVLKEGDEVLVKCISIDRQGRIKLSRKDALAEA